MSRSGYTDDYDEGKIWLYRRAVDNAIGGKRGQAFLRDLKVALDALPEQTLAAGGLVGPEGVCAMGAVALHRGIDRETLARVDADDPEIVADLLNIAPSMAKDFKRQLRRAERWSAGRLQARS